MTKKKRSVLISVLIGLLCVALVASGTYALFSDRVTLKNHLQAGTLDITLIRTYLATTTLNSTTGFLVKGENPEDIDFSKPADPNDPNAKNKNVFDIASDALIVPGCKYFAEMQIQNNSDVAFGYWLEIVFDDESQAALAHQLNVKIVTVDGTVEKRLDEMSTFIGSESDTIATLAKGGSTLFTISVEFLDLDDDVNNEAKSQQAGFDLVIHAIQATEPNS